MQPIPPRTGAFHDPPSATHDRGHAGAELGAAYPGDVYFDVSLFALYFRKSPELLGPEQIRDYQLYLTNQRELAPSSIVVTTAALRFLYNTTLKRGWNLEASIPAPRQPKKLPVVLSRAEVLHFLDCVEDIKHQAILTTCCAAGLRISEAVRLKTSSLDNQRMVIRVAQGKGHKDR